MMVIPETHHGHNIRYLRFYYSSTDPPNIIETCCVFFLSVFNLLHALRYNKELYINVLPLYANKASIPPIQLP
jgi:hypothetical protein